MALYGHQQNIQNIPAMHTPLSSSVGYIEATLHLHSEFQLETMLRCMRQISRRLQSYPVEDVARLTLELRTRHFHGMLAVAADRLQRMACLENLEATRTQAALDLIETVYEVSSMKGIPISCLETVYILNHIGDLDNFWGAVKWVRVSLEWTLNMVLLYCTPSAAVVDYLVNRVESRRRTKPCKYFMINLGATWHRLSHTDLCSLQPPIVQLIHGLQHRSLLPGDTLQIDELYHEVFRPSRIQI